jgi:peptidoglycan hydrolase-like protein with peptidoglycan-binding domain
VSTTQITLTLPVLRKGVEDHEGVAVNRLQEMLNLYVGGPYTVEPNGTFGPETEEAVNIFKRGQNLPDDGIVGPRAWTRLLEAFFSSLGFG